MIDRATDSRMRAMEAEIARLRNSIYQRPIHVATGGASTLKKLEIIDGNTVHNVGGVTYYGITPETSQITTVPSAYDPNGVADTPGLFTAIDGIGRAKLFISGVEQASRVLVVHDTRSRHFFEMVTLDYPTAGNMVSILVGAGPATVSAYLIDYP